MFKDKGHATHKIYVSHIYTGNPLIGEGDINKYKSPNIMYLKSFFF